jgi:hypothetical protein
MQNELNATFVRKELIAERLVQRASELWGAEHPDYIDPIVKLMVDVLAYELARLGTEMATSDGKVLENLANILVPGTWRLPQPAHAVLSAQPLELKAVLGISNQLYVPIKDKAVTGEETITDLFFSPLQTVALVKGKVAFTVVQQTICQVMENGQSIRTTSSLAARPSFNGLWLGLDLADGIAELDTLDIYLQLPDSALPMEPLLALSQWCLDTGEALTAKPYALEEAYGAEDAYDGQSFALLYPEHAVLADIAGSYRYKFFSLAATGGRAIPVRKQRYPPSLEEVFSAGNLEVLEKPLFWVKIELPAAFNMQVVAQTQFSLNCFPIVAKRQHYIQQRLHAGLNIVPLKLPESGAMFYVQSVMDEQGRQLRKRQFNATATTGTYLQHQGDLERLDRMTAEGYLGKMVRLVQEESGVFSAYGQELMLKQINNLRNDLEAIRKQLGAVAQAAVQERHYLLVEPFADSKTLEITYWSTEQRSFKQFLYPGMTLLPYKQVTVQPGSARLKSSLTAGKASPQSDDKIRAMRYGFLTRNRIVSKQDVRQFVLHALAGYISDVEVRNGVAISEDPKKGLVRTVELLLRPEPTVLMSAEDWGNLLGSLQENLNTRSVHTAIYRLNLLPPSNSSYIN